MGFVTRKKLEEMKPSFKKSSKPLVPGTISLCHCWTTMATPSQDWNPNCHTDTSSPVSGKHNSSNYLPKLSYLGNSQATVMVKSRFKSKKNVFRHRESGWSVWALKMWKNFSQTSWHGESFKRLDTYKRIILFT